MIRPMPDVDSIAEANELAKNVIARDSFYVLISRYYLGTVSVEDLVTYLDTLGAIEENKLFPFKKTTHPAEHA